MSISSQPSNKSGETVVASHLLLPLTLSLTNEPREVRGFNLATLYMMLELFSRGWVSMSIYRIWERGSHLNDNHPTLTLTIS